MVGPPGSVEGKVVAAETSQPVQGVRVRLQSSSEGLYGGVTFESSLSGPDGAFRVLEVVPGKYRVSAAGTTPGSGGPEWMAEWWKNPEVKVVGGQTARDVVVRASQAALVEVTVVAEDDLQPLAGVEVSGSRFIGSASAYTDAGGVGRFWAPPGRCAIAASLKDWAQQVIPTNIVIGQTTHLRFELTRPLTISGTIRDPAGVPVPGVLVSFHPGTLPGVFPYVDGRTDANGRYELRMVAELSEAAPPGGLGRPSNLILARSLERNLAAIREFETIPTNLDLTLEPGLTLSGCVKGTDGKPVTSALVDLSIHSLPWLPKVDPRPAHVDALGRFALPALPQARRYLVAAFTYQGYGRASAELAPYDAKPGRFDFPPFVLERADRKLAGQVLGPDEQPLAGAYVFLSGMGQSERSHAMSDSQGRFVFDAVCDGRIGVHAHGLGPPEMEPGVLTYMAEPSAVMAQAGDTNVVVRIRSHNRAATTDPFVPASGKLFDPSGAPAAGVLLRVWQVRGATQSAHSNRNGEYTICRQRPPAAPGVSSNSVLVARDAAHQWAAACPLDAMATNLDLHLKAGLTITG